MNVVILVSMIKINEKIFSISLSVCISDQQEDNLCQAKKWYAHIITQNIFEKFQSHIQYKDIGIFFIIFQNFGDNIISSLSPFPQYPISRGVYVRT